MADSTRDKVGIKAIFFDFMGTCLDWHSSIVNAFPATLSKQQKSDLALEWREAFFDAIRNLPLGEAPEDIDFTHTRLLKELLARSANTDLARHFQAEHGDFDQAVQRAVRAWHHMDAWPDVRAGLNRIRSDCSGCELFVLANGTTRLQVDLVRSSNLRFDLLFSSQLLGVAKPTPAIYRKAMDLVKVQDPRHAVMVAAHAYDLRAAKDVGMRTIYVRRWTDDGHESDEQRLYRENDGNVLDDFGGLADVVNRFSR